MFVISQPVAVIFLAIVVVHSGVVVAVDERSEENFIITTEEEEEQPVSYMLRPFTTEQISYVLEPFESIDPDWGVFTSGPADEGSITVSSTSDAIISGTNALKVDYEVLHHLSWGGNAAISSFSKATSFSCEGASHLSLWYKVLEPQSLPLSAYIRFVLLDSSDFNTASSKARDMEFYYSFQHILDEPEPIWKELKIGLQGSASEKTPFWLTAMNGRHGNRVLDLSHIVGFKIIFQMHWEEEAGAISSGSILFDQLACVGGGDLLSASLRKTDQSESIANDDRVSYRGLDVQWDEFVENEQVINPFIRGKGSTFELSDSTGMVNLQYPQIAPQGSDAWNGMLVILHEAPKSAYYNLSQATGISFDFEFLATESDQESSVVVELNMLSDSNGVSQAYSIIRSSIQDPFDSTRTLSRSFINEPLESEFDLSRVLGFRLSINAESELVPGLHSMGVGAIRADLPVVVEAPIDDTTAQCIVEPGITLHGTGEEQRTMFTTYVFAAHECCSICERDPECTLGWIRLGSCLLTSAVRPEQVNLQGNSNIALTYSMFWTDDVAKRGDFCDKCECRESDLTIDCRGYDLAVLPKTFGLAKDSTQRPFWRPRVLDLRENKRLLLIGTNSLESIRDSIQEIRLSEDVRYISEEEMSRLSGNLTLVIEDSEVEELISTVSTDGTGGRGLVNAVTRSDSEAFFGSVCCSRGHEFSLVSPTEHITFCNVTLDSPGIDSLYRPGWRYDVLGWLEDITVDSPMFSEASESLEKCAQYCAISRECTYFQYDQRVDEGIFGCKLLRGTDESRFRESPVFAGENTTALRWISGVPPQSRHYKGAFVLVDQQSIFLNEGNRFAANITFSLGSQPMRGAVWIKPKLDSSTSSGLNVTFDPPMVVLFDANSIATVSVTVHNGNFLSKKKTIIIQSTIEACDQAFIQGTTNCTVYASIEPTEVNLVLVVCAVIGTMIFISLGTLWLVLFRKRRQADSVWLVKRSELLFSDPPEVAGRGTFGLVLLAEYRGTVVAVKRVIPPNTRRRHDQSLISAHHNVSFCSAILEECGGSKSEAEESPHANRLCSISGHNSGAVSMHRKCQRLSSDVSLGHSSSSGLGGNLRRLSPSVGMSSRTPWNKLKDDFVTEMRLLSKLRHPCITTVMGAVIGRKEEPMLVMEYMDHGSLFDLLQNDTLLLEGEILLPILRDISQGMRFLHAATPQVIHADLKAQNVLVDSKFRAKVADFGLSQKRQVGAIGTPYWMAPELLRGATRATAECDVYSFGIMLYEVYSRKEPYVGEDPKEVLRQVADPAINKRPPCPDVCPAQVEYLMNDCLVADPEKRPKFEELDQRLKRASASALNPGELLQSLQQMKKQKLELRQSTELLYEIFPEHIAKALSEGRKVEPQQRDVVTIFFSDIVGFTKIASSMSAMKVSCMLDRLYSTFDALSRAHDVFKVETIGDAYMAVTNLVKDQPDHAKRIAEFALAVTEVANQTLIDEDDPSRGTISIRVGFDSGSVVANVVGSVNPRYCLFGDTVNTASRMESTSQKNRIHCSERAALLLHNQAPNLSILPRGMVAVKGKGEMSTYWVGEGGRDPQQSTLPKSSGDKVLSPQRSVKIMFRRKSMSS